MTVLDPPPSRSNRTEPPTSQAERRHPGRDDELVLVAAPVEFWRGFFPAVREIVAHRELLLNLTKKELKVMYKGSVLGFFWTLLRPAFQLVIYYIVIGKFLGSGIPNFAIYIFSGLMAFDLFNGVIGGCTGCIVNNAGLIKKIWFPREIIPLSVVGASLFHFFLQLLVMGISMAIARYSPFGWNLLYLPLALTALTIFVTALGLWLAAANVYLRDTQHLVGVVLMFWFWMTPVVYPISSTLTKLGEQGEWLRRLYLLNPMTVVVIGFHRGIYKHVKVNGTTVLYDGPVLPRLLAVIVFSLGLLFLAQRTFARAEGNFAQEL